MGVFATVYVDNSIDLPHFPEEIDREGMSWQSKQGLDVYAGPYRITADGRLEQKKESYREKTAEEKQAEAEKWGFDSWDEYVQAYEDSEKTLYPDAVDYDPDDDSIEDHPPFFPSEETVDETWWADISHHGTFEFHQVIKRDPTDTEVIEGPNGEVERPTNYALNAFLEYEARFNKGDLDGIVFMGSRASPSDDPIGEALDKIEEWREWRNSQ